MVNSWIFTHRAEIILLLDRRAVVDKSGNGIFHRARYYVQR